MMRKLVTFGFFAALLAPVGLSAQAEVTANVGYLSQYYYRGLLQKTSSANGGLDVAANAFSAGTWAADVGDGAEIDLYASVGTDLGENGSVSIGGTGYFYTGEFDTRYLEGNLGLAFGPLSFDGALGTYQADPEDYKYVFLSVTGTAPNGLFATVGTSAYNTAGISDALSDAFDKDLAAMYLEAGYGFSAADLDFTFSGIWNNWVASGEVDGDGNPTNELTFVFGVSKTFTIPTS